MYDEGDIFEAEHECTSCVDYRKNLRCCREVFDILKRVDALEARLEAVEGKKKSD